MAVGGIYDTNCVDSGSPYCGTNQMHLIHATVGLAELTKFVSYVPPTTVVKLLQHNGLGSNTGMGFHPMNDLHQC